MNDVAQNLKNIIENIINDNDVISCYRNLSILFENNNMYQEQAGCLERIVHITDEPYLYEKIGDIFKNKLNNYPVAFATYSKYLSLVLPDFYKNYSETFKNKISLIDINSYDKDFIKLTDKYIVVVYVILYLYNTENFDIITEFEKYLNSIAKSVNERIMHISSKNRDTLEDINDAKVYLSSVLINKIDNIKLNQFAINLNKKNETAYINILYNHLINNDFSLAKDFYNNIYAKEFNLEKELNEKNILWYISSKYLELEKPFEAVNCQQMVINMELMNNEK